MVQTWRMESVFLKSRMHDDPWLANVELKFDLQRTVR